MRCSELLRAVTPAAPTAFAPATFPHGLRHPPQSLSLGSFGDFHAHAFILQTKRRTPKTMTKHLSFYSLILAAVFFGNVATAAPISSVEQVLNGAPPATLRKLSNKKTMAEGQAEINKHFGANVINQPALLKAKIEFSEATPDGRNKYRIRATNVPVKWKGGKMDRLVWFYFPAANIPQEGSATVGSDIIVSGIVRRCEVVTVNDSLRINFDLVESKLEQADR